VNDWPGRQYAETLRQWATLAAVADTVARHPATEGLLAIGSLARGSADEFSDLDLLVVVADGQFGRAWAERDDFTPAETLALWDEVEDSPETGVRKFITRDVVKVELVFTTGDGFELAEPYAALVGDASLVDRFTLRAPITQDELEAYAQQRIESGAAPDVEVRYGELMRALRAARRY
jgi:hypothetical protein